MKTILFTTLALAATLLAYTAARPAADTAVACSGDPERFDQLVREADLIAIVRAESVGAASNAAPTIQPTFTPYPEATPPPYPHEDLSGIGATLLVEEVIAGEASTPLQVDYRRRDAIQQRERERESVWPGMVVSCSVRFMVPGYEQGVRYVALYRWTGLEYETVRLHKLSPQGLAPDQYIGLSLAAYEKFFADLPAEIFDYANPEGELDHALMRNPAISTDRFVAFIRSARGDLTPPETGSAGLR